MLQYVHDIWGGSKELHPEEEVMYNMCMASLAIMKPFKSYDEQIEIIRKHGLLLSQNKRIPKIHGPAIFHIDNKFSRVLSFPITLHQMRKAYINASIELIKKRNLLTPLNKKSSKAYGLRKRLVPINSYQVRKARIDVLIGLTRKRNSLPPLNKSVPKIHKSSVIHIANRPEKILVPINLHQIRENLISNSDDYVKEILQTYGYYNIINQYNKPFLNKDRSYKPHIDFFKLYSLQQIDTEIKNIIFYPILQIEQRLKTCISYEFAKAYGPFEDDDMSHYQEPYFNRNNYNVLLKAGKNGYKFESVIKRLKKIYESSSYKPFKHYKEKHKHIPIWVFINEFTYGEVCHFYEVLKIQSNIANKFYLTPSQLRTMMIFLNQVRNDCAHFSGFYNQNYPKIKKDLPLLTDFQNKFNFTSQEYIPNIFLLLIICKYLLPKNRYPDFLSAIKSRIFELTFNQYIPQISEYMQDKLSIKTVNEYQMKLTFLKNYVVK